MSPGSRGRVSEDAYGLAEHRHRFGLWVASRVSRRAFRGATNAQLSDALGSSGVVEVVSSPPSQWPATADAFDRLHPSWCERVSRALAAQGVGVTWGRAAHLVATYLKATVVLGEDAYSSFGRVLHPPVDAALLKGLVTAGESHFRRHQPHWREVRWARLDGDAYFHLVSTLREAARDLGLPALWMLERYRAPDEP